LNAWGIYTAADFRLADQISSEAGYPMRRPDWQ